MYQSNYSVPQTGPTVYDSNYPVVTDPYMQNGDDRLLFGPLLLGGLAGGAIGYGIGANNNRPCCGGGYAPMPVYVPTQSPYYPQPAMSSYNNFYM